jgi:hypothetical protein
LTLLTVDELREHVTTTLGDDALQRLLDDAEAAIIEYAGEIGTLTEFVRGGAGTIVTSRPIDTITSIIERTDSYVPVTLATDDYRVRNSYVIDRLRLGTNRWLHWRGVVEITYEPIDDTATRKIVQAELIQLELDTKPGLASETVGAWTQTYSSIGSKSVPEQRLDILTRLKPTVGLSIVGGYSRPVGLFPGPY